MKNLFLGRIRIAFACEMESDGPSDEEHLLRRCCRRALEESAQGAQSERVSYIRFLFLCRLSSRIRRTVNITIIVPKASISAIIKILGFGPLPCVLDDIGEPNKGLH